MAVLLACTSAEGRPEVAGLDASDLLRPSDVGVLLIAESSSPVSGSGRTLTIYGDGWATLATSGGAFVGEDEYEASDRTLQIRGSQLDRVRALVADPGFLGAESDYHEENVLDGGGTIFAAGAPARRIVVVNRPGNLPDALRDLQVEATAIADRIEAQGGDPFDDPELPARARIVLRYDWWAAGFGGADRLTVFDDGLLEYRRTSSAVMPDPDADFPTPVAITRRVDPGELARLRGLVSSRTVRVLPLLGQREDRDADSHHVRVRGKTLLRYSPRELEPPLQSIVDEAARFLEPLRSET